ncbi:hypothetical protein [Stieleria varia]|uniref:Uncharacterized protein n=1 Tax=Stieleria varia TaxID=2528005 RepID=A0A5C6BAH0_9BACT|nr:hypothetical protein [Stieleria varia]TWU08441.1 hypothetical protein Pla52n_10240 [Stieleria varia]
MMREPYFVMQSMTYASAITSSANDIRVPCEAALQSISRLGETLLRVFADTISRKSSGFTQVSAWP